MNDLLLSVIIPAYNEEKNIGLTLMELRKPLIQNNIPYEIIVVNDNSKDNTLNIIQEYMQSDASIRVVNRTPPGGFGRALRAGLDAVKGDIVVIYMADLSDRPEDVVIYYRKIEEGYDCVFGSRFLKASRVENYPIVKLIVNRIINKMIQILFWTRFNDLTNAFKAFRTHVIQECGPYRASHFNITIEMSLSALARKYYIAQVPIHWYGRTWGSSNLHLSQMGRRYLSTLLKIFFERMLISDDLMAERLNLKRNEEFYNISNSKRIDALEKKLAILEKERDSQSISGAGPTH